MDKPVHPSWQLLEDELQQWQQPAALWWRDDDAVADTAALRQLISLQQPDGAIALHLASIPQLLEASLPKLVRQSPNLWILQHGYNHQNHAREGQRKIELGGTQSTEQLQDKLSNGRKLLQQAFGERYVDIIVPPWNRTETAAETAITALGYRALSGLGPRAEHNYSGTKLNVHIDIIDWKKRAFIGTQQCLESIVAQLRARRLSATDTAEPVGLMTHHLAHDQGCWDFLGELMIKTAAHPKIVWLQAEQALAR